MASMSLFRVKLLKNLVYQNSVYQESDEPRSAAES